MVNFEIEKEYISDGFNCICGVDEAGRGPLAGPEKADRKKARGTL